MIAVNMDVTSTRVAISNLARTLPGAAARALNRSTSSAKTVQVRAIAEDMGIKQNVIRGLVRQQMATPSTLVSALMVSGARIPLEAFNARGALPSLGKGRGVTYKIGQSKRTRLEHAFRARMPGSGHIGVFERTPGKFMKKQIPGRKPRQAIHEKKGPSVPKVFRVYVPEAVARFQEQMPKNLKHECEFALAQAATKESRP